MSNDIKKLLLDNPEYIKELLEYFGFSHISFHNDEIRCGLDEGHNSMSIRIKLKNNDNIFVKDFGRDLCYDIITYIIKTKEVSFIDVIQAIKRIAGITDFYSSDSKKDVFGGFYARIKNKLNTYTSKTYNLNVLNDYEQAYNTRFLKDYIDFETQNHFGLRYDMQSQRIVIPIYDAYGELVGAKGRANWEIQDDEPKYLYLIPCAVSNTLYGYHQNYEYLSNNDILVFEAEKSCMQCYSYGIHNCVALGSSSLSNQQCKLLMELNPKDIIFMYDEGLDMNVIKNNAKKLSAYCKMRDTKIKYWDSTIDKTIPHKASASDLGKDKFLEILKTQIKDVILSKSDGTSSQIAEDYLTLIL